MIMRHLIITAAVAALSAFCPPSYAEGVNAGTQTLKESDAGTQTDFTQSPALGPVDMEIENLTSEEAPVPMEIDTPKPTNDPKTLLFFNALTTGNMEQINQHLSQGASVNTKFENQLTPMLIAAARSDEALIDLLLSKGGNINDTNKIGVTPLMFAVLANNKNIAGKLLSKGAPINARTQDGWTALLFAAMRGKPTMVIFLLNKGANINEKNKFGGTPLMGAVVKGRRNVVQVLVNKNAKIDEKANNGQTALSLALDELKQAKTDAQKKTLTDIIALLNGNSKDRIPSPTDSNTVRGTPSPVNDSGSRSTSPSDSVVRNTPSPVDGQGQKRSLDQVEGSLPIQGNQKK